MISFTYPRIPEANYFSKILLKSLSGTAGKNFSTISA
jgi:hypothetical protein